MGFHRKQFINIYFLERKNKPKYADIRDFNSDFGKNKYMYALNREQS